MFSPPAPPLRGGRVVGKVRVLPADLAPAPRATAVARPAAPVVTPISAFVIDIRTELPLIPAPRVPPSIAVPYSVRRLRAEGAYGCGRLLMEARDGAGTSLMKLEEQPASSRSGRRARGA